MKLLLLVLLAGTCVGQPYTRIYTDQDQTGFYYDIYSNIPKLDEIGFNDDMESVTQNGMWLYYENNNYNLEIGMVYWVHGIEVDYSFPSEFVNECSAVRYVGSPDYINEETWTVYEDAAFAGTQYYAMDDSPTVGGVGVSSLILTGNSPWTFYTEENWLGLSVCIYPDTHHDVGDGVNRLDLGIFPDAASFGLPDNTISSVLRGCWTTNVVTASKLQADGTQENGAWGHIAV